MFVSIIFDDSSSSFLDSTFFASSSRVWACSRFCTTNLLLNSEERLCGDELRMYVQEEAHDISQVHPVLVLVLLGYLQPPFSVSLLQHMSIPLLNHFWPPPPGGVYYMR